MNSITLTVDQLCSLADILLGLAHADGDFDFLEAGEINDVLTDLIDGAVPVEVARHMSLFDNADFDLKTACESILEAEEVDPTALVSLLVQIANADSVFDVSEHEYVSRVADLLGSPLENLEESYVEVIELAPPPVPN